MPYRAMATVQLRDVNGFLDEMQDRLLVGDAVASVRLLIDRLREYRQASSEEDWRDRIRPACLQHGIRDLLHQDPYTRRAFAKPRGYAGDAVMLDYVYRGDAPSETTRLGREIFYCTTRLPNGLSVVARRDYLATNIDQIACVSDRPRILSIACGHLREAQCSRAVQDRSVGEFFALDQDPESLAVVEKEQSAQGVTPVLGSVRSLLRGGMPFSDLDFVYAAGLFDYLSDAVATRLTARMFEMLAPGGRLLIANFVPESHGRGYMEAFMDWELTYRDEADLSSLTREIPMRAISWQRAFRDSYGNIVYLELGREPA
jgi:extracellular factor (EF) 3-hydroxypalmitic acid methyl ester biosynthesis protein